MPDTSSGAELEDTFERFMKRKNIPVVYREDYEADQFIHENARRILVKNVHYTKFNDDTGRMEFLLIDRLSGVRRRYEIKNQDVSGSVEEKYPAVLASLNKKQNKKVFNELTIIYNDNTAISPGTIRWLNQEAKQDPRLDVASFSEFKANFV